MVEDVLASKMKSSSQKQKDTELHESIKSRLLSGLYDVTRKGFDLNHLSEDEISLLFEYVSN
jgi:hypothetical protein